MMITGCFSSFIIMAMITTPITGALDHLSVGAFIVAFTIGLAKLWKEAEERWSRWDDLEGDDHSDF